MPPDDSQDAVSGREKPEPGAQSEPGASTVADLLGWAQSWLGAEGIEAPRREARLLLGWALKLDQADLLPGDGARLVEPQARVGFVAAVRRRAGRAPLAYITGRQGFWTLDLEVSDATLIPRADSETVIELLRRLRPDRSAPLRILDLGTGTGCLLLAAVSDYPQASGIGIDISARAAALAGRNAVTTGLQSRVRFVCGSWRDPIRPGTKFDLVLSNPPYIRAADLAGLMPEVARFEPHAALDGGLDGLDAYRVIVASLPELLEPQGVAILEIGAGQEHEVACLAVDAGLMPEQTARDLSGTVRALALGLA